jgi:cystathionine beta-lyase/cystathionine gamma-synthase
MTERAPGMPLAPPLVLASVYVSEGEPVPGRAYGRNGNPGWEALEEALGGIEQASAVAFASGQAAAMALMLALCEGRERLVLPTDGYYGIRSLAERLRPHGVVVASADLLDLAAVERELLAGRAVLWTETPTNPLLRVADLARLGEIAAACDALMVTDNTLATGVLQRPLELGAVASVYSLTKSVSGHSDVVLGAVLTRDAGLLDSVRWWRASGGAIPGPFESWLALRGLKTLALRMERSSANALAVAGFLARHPRVRTVHYPGLGMVPDGQMNGGFGPLLSFELAGTAADADAVVGASRVLVPATSFGGVESTWERRARWAGETAPESLIRLSAGIEPVEELIADVAAALAAPPC